MEEALKLLLKEAIRKLERQYKFGSSMEKQDVIVKLFDPTSSWSWYLMNIDPKDHGYAWGIVKGFAIEMGNIDIQKLEVAKLPIGLSIERDLYFKPMPAIEVWKKLNKEEYV